MSGPHRVLVIVALTGTAVIAVSVGVRDDGPITVVYDPGALVPRVTVDEHVPQELTSAWDFSVSNADLFVLDRLRGTVVQLQRSGGAWMTVRVFGEKGEGPGELDTPVAIAALAGGAGTLVMERSGQLELFDSAGAWLETRRVRQPCAAVRPQIHPAGDGLFVTAGCPGDPTVAGSPDTVYHVLWLTQGGDGRTLAREPAHSVDGKWGSVFTARSPLATTESHIYFGAGSDGCLHWGEAPGWATLLRRDCREDLPRFSAPPPESFRPRGGRFGPRAWKWPDPLPAFLGLVGLEHGVVLVRPFSADSALVEYVPWPPGGPDLGADLLVAPLDSFVGCKVEACLWYDPELEGGRVRVVTTPELEALVRRARGGPRTGGTNDTLREN